MWHWFLDILFLNDVDDDENYKPNPLGMFIVTTWIVMAWTGVMAYLQGGRADDLHQLRTDIENITQERIKSDQEQSQEADELTTALRDEYDQLFNAEKQKNSDLSKQVKSLRRKLDEKATKTECDWRDARYPRELFPNRVQQTASG